MKQQKETGLPRSWVDRWLFDAFVRSREAQLHRKLRAEEKKTLEHLARYITLLQYLSRRSPSRVSGWSTPIPRPARRPVGVDLVLDVGNSRTCGILIETYPNDRSVGFRTRWCWRCATSPIRTSSTASRSTAMSNSPRPISDRAHHSHLIRTHAGFLWPSAVRVGPEASQFREAAEGSEGASGMSSPKRYLCDLMPVNQEWRFQPRDYDADANPPLVARKLFRFVNSRGDVIRETTRKRGSMVRSPPRSAPVPTAAFLGADLLAILDLHADARRSHHAGLSA